MSECYKCSHMGYHGIRRDGWPSTMFMFCEDYGHNRPPNCTLFDEGEPHWFDKYGVEMTLDELNATFGGGECEFTVEYDRDEVERRRKMYEENPFGLFPQDMPQSAWTCSNCGQQFKCHYNRHTGELLPVPSWIKHCPNCGKAVKR